MRGPWAAGRLPTAEAHIMILKIEPFIHSPRPARALPSSLISAILSHTPLLRLCLAEENRIHTLLQTRNTSPSNAVSTSGDCSELIYGNLYFSSPTSPPPNKHFPSATPPTQPNQLPTLPTSTRRLPSTIISSSSDSASSPSARGDTPIHRATVPLTHFNSTRALQARKNPYLTLP
jgi:hypothetical protein